MHRVSLISLCLPLSDTFSPIDTYYLAAAGGVDGGKTLLRVISCSTTFLLRLFECFVVIVVVITLVGQVSMPEIRCERRVCCSCVAVVVGIVVYLVELIRLTRIRVSES